MSTQLDFRKLAISTRILLDEDFVNRKVLPAIKLTAPDGFSVFYRLNLSHDLRELLSHSGVKIEEFNEERTPRTVILGGVILKQVESRVLEFKSKDRPTARELYHSRVKPELEQLGYSRTKVKCTQIYLGEEDEDCNDENLDRYV